MLIHFAKMHGLGNDFVVIDRIRQSMALKIPQIQRLADRHLGIGCDQVLFIEPPIRPEAHFFYRIFNANGREVEQCGNGLRCVAKFFQECGLTNQSQLDVDCLAGAQRCWIESDGSIRVEMFLPPSTAPHAPEESLFLDHIPYEVHTLSMGNPHAILLVPDVEAVDLNTIGRALNQHPHFPEGVNVGLMQIIHSKKIRLRVYERHVGETLACGSNACAAVVTGIRLGHLDTTVEACFQKGVLHIQWPHPDSAVYMQGPAQTTFIGRFRL